MQFYCVWSLLIENEVFGRGAKCQKLLKINIFDILNPLQNMVTADPKSPPNLVLPPKSPPNDKIPPNAPQMAVRYPPNMHVYFVLTFAENEN